MSPTTYTVSTGISTLSTVPTTITNPIYCSINNLEIREYILYNEKDDSLRGNAWHREAPMDIIKVSANSRTSAVAGAIAGVIREHKHAEVQAIGAGAVNQAMKALVLAIGYLKEDGIRVVCVPEFADVTIDDKVRTAIKLVIEVR
jgi:stage V sporulation protein S